MSRVACPGWIALRIVLGYMPDMTVYTIRTSSRLRIGIAALHLLVGVAIFLADIPWAIRLLLSGVVVASLVKNWPRRREEKLRTDERAGLQLWLDSEWQDVVLLEETVVQPAMTVLSLRLHEDGQRKRLVILGDSMDSDECRRLRAWVKWKGLNGVA
jgi:hypothetical protein